eukprot:CAMPEP_0118665082 /NCGR_PEP_ID=MMETSP0785-20121206/18410_1 /TAXON_ID=91992 /ORGANISM="Bolidomonas pacifica, Strain CCMP 1866" /LENGTH=30 /DNA_ID= /DNA_START= /DNA_END= /DNA_ORIENTATION=
MTQLSSNPSTLEMTQTPNRQPVHLERARKA